MKRARSLVWAAAMAAGLIAADAAAPGAAYAQDVTMNFKDADIRAFIQFVAGFSGKDFVIDNRVKGRVSIVSPTPIPADQAYQVFLSVLEINGYAAVPSGPVVKIVPRAEGKQKALPVRADGRGLAGDAMVTQVIRLRYADAQQLVALIRPLLAPNAHLVAYPRGNMLLATDSAANVGRIRRILEMMDRKDAVGVRLFRLQHASADKVAKTLGKLYAPAAGRQGLKALAHDPGNMLIVVGPPPLIQEAVSVVRRLDAPPRTDSGRVRVRHLRFADAGDVAKVINELLAGGATGGPGGKGRGPRRVVAGAVKVVPDKGENALVMNADPSDMRTLERLVDQLDVPRRQVLVEALIVEVSTNAAQQFGIEWRGVSSPNNPKVRPFGGTNFPNQAGTSLTSVAANPLNPGAGLVVGLAKGTVTFAGQEFMNIGALARALESQADTNVLSTPDLLTLDNEEAEIVVGQNVPFVTGRSSTQGGVANPFQTIERKDIGLKLRVKPQISDGGMVRLNLYQEISSLARNPGVQGADLITNKRSIKTTVLARDGQMIVLGGLMRDDSIASVQRVPCIGAIPILGEPFKFTENQHRKTNLMVFLRPHVLHTAADSDGLTRERYERLRDLYEMPTEGGTIIFPKRQLHMPDEFRPAAPPAGKSTTGAGAAGHPTAGHGTAPSSAAAPKPGGGARP